MKNKKIKQTLYSLLKLVQHKSEEKIFRVWCESSTSEKNHKLHACIMRMLEILVINSVNDREHFRHHTNTHPHIYTCSSVGEEFL